MSTQISQKLYHIQALRGFAAILVMLAHLYDAEVKYSADHLLGPWTLYGNLGVDIFFLISGFIMVYTTWARPRGVKAASEFLFRRSIRIYPLYWLVSLAVFIIFLIRPDMVFASRETAPTLWKSFLLFPDVVPPLLLVGWTLIFEMYFYLIFTVIMCFKKNWLLPALAIWSLIIFAARGAGWHEGGPVREIILNPLAYEFIFGALAAYILQTQQSLIGRLFNSKNILYFGAGLLAVWAFQLLRLEEFPTTFPSRVINFIIPVTLLISYAAIRDYLNMKVWPVFITLGNWSYSLYLTHILSIAVIGRVWHKFTSETWLDNFMAIIIMTAFSIAVSGLTYKLFEVPMLRLGQKIRSFIFKGT